MNERKIKTACVQLRCGDDVVANIRDAAELIRAARKDGAQFIATPENTGLMARDGGADCGQNHRANARAIRHRSSRPMGGNWTRHRVLLL